MNKADQIIAHGDVTMLIQTAQAVGNAITQQELSNSQIRNVFGEVRRIEASWPAYSEQWTESERERAQQAYRNAVLLRPKLAYQTRRERGKDKKGVKTLQEALDPCLQVVQNAQTDKERKLYFDRFVDFFEAILAYHNSEVVRQN